MKKDSQTDLWAKVRGKRYPRKDLKKVDKQVRVPPETSEQSTVIDWARNWGSKLDGIDMLHSVPNGAVLGNPNYNPFALIGKLKREGLKNGVGDLFLACARQGFHGYYLEAKRRKGGKQSDDQISWMIRCREEGYKYDVFETAAEGIALLTAYLKYDY
jgi:hypothetical protein